MIDSNRLSLALRNNKDIVDSTSDVGGAVFALEVPLGVVLYAQPKVTPPGVSVALQEAIYQMVSANEVSSNAAVANQLTRSSGNWTLGWIQDDFHAGQSNANTLLTSALQAAGYGAASIRVIETALDSGSGQAKQAAIDTLLLNGGATNPDGSQATVNSINSVLNSNAVAGAVINNVSESQLATKDYSQTDATSLLNRLFNADTVGDYGALNPSLSAALQNPQTQGELLATLVDYNNQFGLDTNKQMWQLLTQGSAIFGGSLNGTYAPSVQVTLDTTNTATMLQSILSGEFNTNYGYNNPDDVCRREAEQVAAYNAYAQANGDQTLTNPITVTNGLAGDNNSCRITESLSGPSSTTSWTVTDPNGVAASSGSATTNGSSSNWAYNSDTNNSNDTSTATQYNSSGPVDESQQVYSASNEQGSLVSSTDWLAATPSGTVDSVNLSGVTVNLGSLTDASINGGGNNILLLGGDQITVNGQSNSITDTIGGSAINLGAGSSDSFTGINDNFTLNNQVQFTDTAASGVTVRLDPGCTDGIHCAGNTVDMSNNDNLTDDGDTVNVAANQTDTVAGYSDMLVASTGDTLMVSDSGGTGIDTVGLAGGDTLDASTTGVTANLAANTSDTYSGVPGDVANLSNGDTLSDLGAGLSVFDAAGASGGNLTLGASNLGLTDDAAGLTISDSSGISGGGITFGKSNLSAIDDGSSLVFKTGIGVSSDSVTLGASGLNLLDDAVGLSVAENSGVSGGTLTLDATSITFTDDASGLLLADASGISGDKGLLGANNLNLTDDATGLILADGVTSNGLYATGGSLTLGADYISFTDAAAKLTIGDASGITGDKVYLGSNNLNLTDDAAGLFVADGSGVMGGNITFGANGLTLTDLASGGLGLFGASGGSAGTVTSATVTLGMSNLTVDSYLAGLTIDDAPGATGGTLGLAVDNSTVLDNVNNLRVFDGQGISDNTLTFDASGLSLTDTAVALTIANASGDTGDIVNVGVGLTVNDDGNGNTFDQSGGTLNLASFVTGTLTGNNDSIFGTAAANAWDGLTINGNSDTGTFNALSDITLNGTGDTANVGRLSNVFDNMAGNTIDQSAGTLTLAANLTATLNGNGDSIFGTATTTLNGVTASFDTLTDTGNNDTLTIGAWSNVTLDGTNDLATLGGIGAVYDNGSGNTIDSSLRTIDLSNAVSAILNGSNDAGTLGVGATLDALGVSNLFTLNTSSTATFSADTTNSDGIYLANSNTEATAIFDSGSGQSQQQIFNPNSTTGAEISDYAAVNATGALQDQTFEYVNNTSLSDLFNFNLANHIQQVDLTYAEPDGIFGSGTITVGGTTILAADDYNKAVLDLTGIQGFGSQVQLYDNTGSTLPQSVMLMYNDYSGSGGNGTEMNTTADYAASNPANDYSVTTDYNPQMNVNSVTGTFTGINDTGNLSSLSFTDLKDGLTFDDRFTYSGSTELDAYQSVYAGSTRVGYAEFNSQDQLIQEFQGSYGYAGSNFSYSDPGSFGYGSDLPALPGGSSDISQAGLHKYLSTKWRGNGSGCAPALGAHRDRGTSVTAIVAAARSGIGVQPAYGPATVAPAQVVDQMVQAMAGMPLPPPLTSNKASEGLWDRAETLLAHAPA